MNMCTVNQKRMYFFDNLRACIILVVIVFHVAMGYTTWKLPWWYVNDVENSKFFDLFILGIDVFLMPIMFLIAGYFAPAVLFNNGVARFWQNKFRHIVLPWLGGVLFIAPLIAYSAIFSRTDTPPNYLLFWANDFFGKYYQQAHYWFLGILVTFFCLFTLAFMLNPAYFRERLQPGKPSVWLFPLFALLSAVPFFIGNLFFTADDWISVKFIVCIQPVRIGLYLCYFALGIYAWKHAWFTPNGYNPTPLTWTISAITMLVVFLVYRVHYTLGPNIPILPKAGHAIVFSFFALTATFAFIALFQRFVDSNAYLWRRLAANSYTIYFIHQCVVIPLAYIVQNVEISIWVKYIGVSITALILCFLIAEYLIGPVLSIGKKARNLSVRS